MKDDAAELGNDWQVMSAQANFVSVLVDREGWVLTKTPIAIPVPLALRDKPIKSCSLASILHCLLACLAAFQS
jgi:hypothetical protein